MISLINWWNAQPRCINCGKKYTRHSFYSRGMFTKLGLIDISIQRARCKTCNVTHAILPCFIIPYSRFLSKIKGAAIKGHAEGLSAEKIADQLGLIDSRIIKIWWKKFSGKANSLSKWLAKILSSTSGYTKWLRGTPESIKELVCWVFKLLDLLRERCHPDFDFDNFALLNLLNCEYTM